jgi:hypothetical protein
VIFDRYTVEVSGKTTRARKNCVLSFDLSFPAGYSCSLGTVNYRGAAFLDKGVRGYLTATYFFSGVRTQTSLTTQFRGPVQRKDYVISDAFSLQSAVRSPCGAQAPLTLNTAIQLDAGKTGGRGELSTDSSRFMPAIAAPSYSDLIHAVDGRIKQTYGLVWRRCGKK